MSYREAQTADKKKKKKERKEKRKERNNLPMYFKEIKAVTEIAVKYFIIFIFEKLKDLYDFSNGKQLLYQFKNKSA